MAHLGQWLSIFEDDRNDGTTFSFPQPLHVDQDSLSPDKEIVFKGQVLGDGRSINRDATAYKASKPQGMVGFQFRSSDLLKVAYSHFQLGSVEVGVLPYRYHFYPKKDALDWGDHSGYPLGTYGRAVGQPYTVSILKKLVDPGALYGGTSAYFFKHGVCDKLAFSVGVGEVAKANASFRFRDLDYGTAVSVNPNSSEVGSYATTPAFTDWSASVTMNGTALDIASFSLTSDQGVQEFSRVGREAPENYNFDKYKLTGQLSFDLPLDGLKEVGSMFGSLTFSLTATLYNSASDRVIFSLPNCRRMPFDLKAQSGAESIKASLPFEAFESAGTYPIRVTVDTYYDFSGVLMFGDAALGARTLIDYPLYDAGTGARVLSDYAFYNRD